MRIFKKLKFDFGGGLLFAEAPFITITIEEDNVAKLVIKNCKKGHVGNFEYNQKLTSLQAKQFETFAYNNHKNTQTFQTDSASACIVKITNQGKKYIADLNPFDLKPILSTIFPQQITNLIYENFKI